MRIIAFIITVYRGVCFFVSGAVSAVIKIVVLLVYAAGCYALNLLYEWKSFRVSGGLQLALFWCAALFQTVVQVVMFFLL